jgi:hypothetical protein
MKVAFGTWLRSALTRKGETALYVTRSQRPLTGSVSLHFLCGLYLQKGSVLRTEWQSAEFSNAASLNGIRCTVNTDWSRSRLIMWYRYLIYTWWIQSKQVSDCVGSINDRLYGLIVKAPGYRSRGPGSRGRCVRLAILPPSVSRFSNQCGILTSHNLIGLHGQLQG